MGRRKSLFLMLTLITLLFLVPFVAGQAKTQTKAATPKTTKTNAPTKGTAAGGKAKTNTKAKADPTGKADPKATGKADPKATGKADPKATGKADPKAKTATPKATASPKAKTSPAKAKETPKAQNTPTPAAPEASPTPSETALDPNLTQECNDCWTSERSKIPACAGLTEADFDKFNENPTSPKVASCLCAFAGKLDTILNNTCSAVCVDDVLVSDMTSQAAQYKINYKCDTNSNSILGSANANSTTESQTASAISNYINGNGYLGLSFVIGTASFLFFNFI